MNSRVDDFLFLGECLSLDCSEVSIKDLQRKIVDPALDWGPVIAMASERLLVPALWAALLKKGLSRYLDDELKFYLSGFYDLNRQRNLLIKEQVEQIVEAFNSSGIQPILLKGAALLFMDDPAALGYRMMSDIDILADAPDVQASLDILLSLGYGVQDPVLAKRIDPVSQHLPTMSREGSPAAVELHTELFPLYDGTEILTASSCFQNSVQLRSGSFSFKVLSHEDFLIHNIVHSEISHSNFSLGNISLKSLIDFAVISNLYSDTISWSHIEQRMSGHGLRRVYHSYVHKAVKLLGAPIPPGFQAGVMEESDLKLCLSTIRFEWFKTILSRWTWIKRAPVIVSKNLSSEIMTKRFGCSHNFADLNKTRLNYLWFLFGKHALKTKR